MKTLVKNIFTGLSLILTLSFCSEDYLTLTPKDQLTGLNFFQTEEDAQAALHGVYNILAEQSVWGNVHNAAYIEWGMTGDMYEMDRSQGRIQLHSLRLPPTNTYLTAIYQDAYQGIARANIVIKNVSEMEGLNADTRDMIIAQAQYLRGMFYYNLAQFFGGVPLILAPLEASDDFDIPRATWEETWNQIITDFTSAAEVLPLAWDGEDTGRATRTAAWGFLVKSYLWLENWEEVIRFSELILDSGQHDLLPDFRDVFRESNDNNVEILFSTQFSGTIPGASSILPTRSAPRGAPGEFVGSSAWSNYVPNTQWIEDFERDEEGTIIDERYHDVVIGPGEKHQDVDYVLPEEPPSSMTMTGYILTKYWFGLSEFKGGANAPNVRLPEILLAYAEALNELGRQADAMQQVNRVRERASLPPKPLDLSQDEVLDAIFHEYRYEFIWEPTGGFTTLNRRGRFLTFLEENNPLYESLEVDSKPWLHTQPILLPIPAAAYENNNALVQNPHYPAF